METQIEFLKRVGRYGSSKDPQWNRKTKRHDCCGATRAYYHKRDCPLVYDDDLSDLNDFNNRGPVSKENVGKDKPFEISKLITK